MFCQKCGKEIKDGSKICEYCGANLEATVNTDKPKPKMHGCLKAFQIFCGIVLCLVIIGVLFGDETSKTTSTPTSNNETKAKLEILDSAFCKTEYGTKAVCGTVMNNSGDTYDYVQVSINLLDADENLVDSTLANVNNLAPGKKWKFQAPILEDNVKSFKIEEVTGF